MSVCRDLEPLFSAFVDGDLTGDERAAVVTHLDECAACRGVVNDLERLRATARQLGPVAPPDHLWLEVAGQIRLDRGPMSVAAPPSRDRRAVTQWIGLAAALVLTTLGVYLASVLRAPAPETPQTASAPSVDSVAQELTLALQHYDKAISD